MFEVERKYLLKSGQVDIIVAQLAQLDFELGQELELTDYFLPTFDNFDMVRLRQELESAETRFYFTCKSWYLLPDSTRERLEHEEKLSNSLGLTFLNLVKNNSATLHFTKKRRVFTGTLSGQTVSVCLDNVLDLGMFSGDYMEIEVLVKTRTKIDFARSLIDKAAKAISGNDLEPVSMSYYAMLKKHANVN